MLPCNRIFADPQDDLDYDSLMEYLVHRFIKILPLELRESSRD